MGRDKGFHVAPASVVAIAPRKSAMATANQPSSARYPGIEGAFGQGPRSVFVPVLGLSATTEPFAART
jgi:hypothetical protein